MNHDIFIQMQFFMISILWGAIILLAYDVLRILRRLIKHNNIILAIQDLIFWIVASVFIFAMIYKENDGIIRGFAVMGVTIGMVLYHFIVSTFLVNTITKLIQLLLSPFVFVINSIKRFFRFVILKGKKAANFIIIRLKKQMKSYKIRMDAKRQAVSAKKREKSEQKALVKQKQKEQILAKRQKEKEKQLKEKEKQLREKEKQQKEKQQKEKARQQKDRSMQ